LYTIITESKGATLVEQVSAQSVGEAVRAWGCTSKSKPRIACKASVGDDAPTPVVGVTNVWCYSVVDADAVFYLVHLIATRAT
jgi:hypothetical protein